MAQFDADIRLRLLTQGVDKELKRLERKFADAFAKGVKVDPQLERQYSKLTKVVEAAGRSKLASEKLTTAELRKQEAITKRTLQ